MNSFSIHSAPAETLGETASTSLIILRHASTTGNEQRRYVGRRSDEGLSELGVKQAQELGALLREGEYLATQWTRVVYTSPLLRAQQTARICFPRAQIEPVTNLEEMDFGIFEGRSADEMKEDANYRTWVQSGCTDTCPGGESQAQFATRSNAALVLLLQHAVLHKHEHVLVVAHGGTIMAAFAEFACASESRDYFAWHTKPATGFTAQVTFENNVPIFSNCMPVPAHNL